MDSIEDTPKQNLKLGVKLVNEGRNLAVEIHNLVTVVAAWSSTGLWKVIKSIAMRQDGYLHSLVLLPAVPL